MKNKVYSAFLITFSLTLSGCMGVYEGGFECPAGVGVGCKSISEVNEMVNHGVLPPPSRERTSEQTDETHTCESCGRSLVKIQESPEIWINPHYLKASKEKTHKKVGGYGKNPS